MLYEIDNPIELVARWGGDDISRKVLGLWLREAGPPQHPAVRWFADNSDEPAVILRMMDTDCMIQGPPDAVEQACTDLALGHLQADRPWPDEGTEAAWQREGGRLLHLGRVPTSTLASFKRLGFTDWQDEVQPYYQALAWQLTGPPRFAERVRHACRIAGALELLPLYAEGNDDSWDVDYIRACLLHGPSFVCEVDGEPVSWSLTNLGGAMARVFTPPEHRGKGYASSLAALQVDTMLAMQGLAAASVRLDNEGSYRIFQGLGAEPLEEVQTWSNLEWPGE